MCIGFDHACMEFDKGSLMPLPLPFATAASLQSGISALKQSLVKRPSLLANAIINGDFESECVRGTSGINERVFVLDYCRLQDDNTVDERTHYDCC